MASLVKVDLASDRITSEGESDTDEAKEMGLARLSLETGSAEVFLPARRLYEKFGFQHCEPFADMATAKVTPAASR